MYFDTHTHANFRDFDQDRDEVMKRALDAGVWMTNVGTSFEASKSAVELAAKYKQGVFATIGIHPIEQEKFDSEKYSALISDKVVAVGEIGLDYYHLTKTENEIENAVKIQKQLFIEQLHFAKDHNLPVVLHVRNAYEDALGIIKAEYSGTGILHSFTDSWETAKKFLDLGFYVALNGILTYDSTGKLEEVCKNLPSDRILSETDAPYLTPPPYRGKRNEPLYVSYVVEKMAQIRGISVPEMAEQTFQNAMAVYGIKKP